ncbi:hypothetical protein [Oceanobacillus profundus]|uniref:hypothetical protein n=1 Tax=Oceanobacillus profundus TaxID=372463 RepID=UPI00362E1977
MKNVESYQLLGNGTTIDEESSLGEFFNTVSIADRLSYLCGSLSHHLWKIEPVSADERAIGMVHPNGPLFHFIFYFLTVFIISIALRTSSSKSKSSSSAHKQADSSLSTTAIINFIR